MDDDPLANVARKTLSTSSKKHRFLHLILNFENAASHKYVVHMAIRVYE